MLVITSAQSTFWRTTAIASSSIVTFACVPRGGPHLTTRPHNPIPALLLASNAYALGARACAASGVVLLCERALLVHEGVTAGH